MIRDYQNFYKALGRALTDARVRRNMSIAQLARAAEEQYKTVASIESGKSCSLHHLAWMNDILGIDIDTIFKYMEELREQGDNQAKGLDSLI